MTDPLIAVCRGLPCHWVLHNKRGKEGEEEMVVGSSGSSGGWVGVQVRDLSSVKGNALHNDFLLTKTLHILIKDNQFYSVAF